MKRRNFIKTAGTSLGALLLTRGYAGSSGQRDKSGLNYPDQVDVSSDSGVTVPVFINCQKILNL